MTQSGADLIARTLADHGIDSCFANPGTTEMHLLAALGAEARLKLHLCLFEGVATGAADGYARMTGRRPPRCCTWGRVWPMAWPTCTTRARPAAR